MTIDFLVMVESYTLLSALAIMIKVMIDRLLVVQAPASAVRLT